MACDIGIHMKLTNKRSWNEMKFEEKFTSMHITSSTQVFECWIQQEK